MWRKLCALRICALLQHFVLVSVASLFIFSHVTGQSTSLPWFATVVSGYWRIPSKHSHDDYHRWWQHSLKVAAPYVFYYQDEGDRTKVEELRRGLPTIFLQKNLSARDFSCIESSVQYRPSWTHPVHIPSVDLGRIWVAKVCLVAEASRTDFFRTEWFAWADAGLAIYRTTDPPSAEWPNPALLRTLPRNKVIYSNSNGGEIHAVAGTAFMYHRDFALEVVELIRETYESCAADVNTWMCGFDQVLFTRLKSKNSSVFHKIADGYGDVIRVMYG